jgi:DNA-binding transcriptional regulator YdaS (Cro superfamily)
VEKFQKLAEYLERSGLSQREFGLRLSPPVTQSTVGQWVNGKTRIEAERVLDAAQATEWHVTPHDWRGDLYPHPEDGLPREGSQMALRLSSA